MDTMSHYECLMVRVWRRPDAGNETWVGRLDRLGTHETTRFHDPEDLLTHLRALLVSHGPFSPSATATTAGGPAAQHASPATVSKHPLDTQHTGRPAPSESLPSHVPSREEAR